VLLADEGQATMKHVQVRSGAHMSDLNKLDPNQPEPVPPLVIFIINADRSRRWMEKTSWCKDG